MATRSQRTSMSDSMWEHIKTVLPSCRRLRSNRGLLACQSDQVHSLVRRERQLPDRSPVPAPGRRAATCPWKTFAAACSIYSRQALPGVINHWPAPFARFSNNQKSVRRNQGTRWASGSRRNKGSRVGSRCVDAWRCRRCRDPKILALPAVGKIRRINSFSVVVFPAPFAPRKPNISFWFTTSERPSSERTLRFFQKPTS